MYTPLRRRRRGPNLKQRLILYGIIAVTGFAILGFLGSFILFAFYSRNLPSPGKLTEVSDNSTVFYDRDGKILYEMYKNENRVPVDFKDIPDNLKHATVAIEDKTFYTHKGISETGIIRAFLSIIFKRGIQGGSTITQQLVKNTLLSTEQTLPRKIKEAILAIEVERRYSKDQILGMYLNEIPYGGSYSGVGSAAMGYFGKQPKDLTLTESAILAGLPQSPSRYSPYFGIKDAWKGRAQDVLRSMREQGYITKDQEQKSDKELDTIKFTGSADSAVIAPHFVFYVRDLIAQEYGEKLLEQGLKVKTTLSYDVEKQAEQIVKDEVEKLKDYHATNGAAVVLDSQTGDILAMVGSYDYNDPDFGKYNVAVQGQRQPGSTMKPITYAVGFEKGYTPATMLMDVKTIFPDQGGKEYSPVNYDGKFRGPVQVRFALGNSFNIPAVKMLAMIGVHDFLQKATDMGVEGFEPTTANMQKYGLAVTLGGGNATLLDLTSAFSIFARGGTRIEPQAITEITDFNGKTIYKQVKSKEKRVLSPEVSFLISHILTDDNARVEEFGPGSYLHIPGKTVAVKTGTTDDKRDNWAIGFTKSVTTGVWVGNNDNSPMNQKIASGITGASPIWHNIMVALLKKYQDGIMDKPDDVIATTIDATYGGLPKDGNPTRSEYFIKGTEPTDISPVYQKLKISKSTGKLANDIEIRQGNYDEKDFIVIKENDPVSTDGKNRWQEAIDDWARQQSDPKFKPPTDTSDNSADQVLVTIKDPSNMQTINTNDVHIQAKITSLSTIKNIKVFINGNEIISQDGDTRDFEQTKHIDDGVYDLKIQATNDKGKTGDSTIKIGVKKDVPTPTP